MDTRTSLPSASAGSGAADATEATTARSPSPRTSTGLEPVVRGSRAPLARSIRASVPSRPFATSSAPPTTATLSGPGPAGSAPCTLPSSGSTR